MENQETAVETKPVFDPRKNYEWKETSEFIITATEFGVIHRNLSKFLSGPITPSTILGIADIFTIVQTKLKESVESGESKELVTKE